MRKTRLNLEQLRRLTLKHQPKIRTYVGLGEPVALLLKLLSAVLLRKLPY